MRLGPRSYRLHRLSDDGIGTVSWGLAELHPPAPLLIFRRERGASYSARPRKRGGGSGVALDEHGLVPEALGIVGLSRKREHIFANDTEENCSCRNISFTL